MKYFDLRSINSESETWVYDLPYFLAKKDAENKGNIELRRDVRERFLICDENNNRDKMTLENFLYHHIPFSYGVWQMRRYGLVSPNPEIIENIPDVFVGGLTPIYGEKIQRAITYSKNLISKENKENL